MESAQSASTHGCEHNVENSHDSILCKKCITHLKKSAREAHSKLTKEEKGTKWGRFQIKQIRQEIENLKEWNTFHSPEIDAEIKRETKVKFRTLLELKRVRSEICQKCREKSQKLKIGYFLSLQILRTLKKLCRWANIYLMRVYQHICA